MMRTILNTLILALAVVTVACGAKQENHDHEHNDGMEHNDEEEKKEEAQAPNTAPAQEATGILGDYLKLKDALVATKADDAKKAASVLQVSAKDNETVGAILGEIIEAGDVAGQRLAFEKLSKEIFELIKGGDNSITVYKQYCPMALDGKGAFWLSSSEDILNPYFGDAMLTCGSVQEVIAAK